MFCRLTVITLACLLLVSPADAAPKKKKKRGNNNAATARQNAVLQTVFGGNWRTANLNPQQEAHLTRLCQQLAPKIKAAATAQNNIYTPEQKALLERARLMAVRAGVPPKNLEKRVNETRRTIELSDEQKQQKEEAQGKLFAVKLELKTGAAKFLSAQQVNKLFAEGGKKN